MSYHELTYGAIFMGFVLKDSENQVVLGNSTKQHQGGPKIFKKWSKPEI